MRKIQDVALCVAISVLSGIGAIAVVACLPVIATDATLAVERV